MPCTMPCTIHAPAIKVRASILFFFVWGGEDRKEIERTGFFRATLLTLCPLVDANNNKEQPRNLILKREEQWRSTNSRSEPWFFFQKEDTAPSMKVDAVRVALSCDLAGRCSIGKR